ncbi:hypothetical protein HPP92_011511 [Vanilla planifolia]|uniref:Uncharacterized protein n=1 Tax=Vanilla planifolia TaxID=51239 RepID=A0A835V2W1_VANPL|nr:hypothetical protein HPP92_011511 [Vanilla planifolia]
MPEVQSKVEPTFARGLNKNCLPPSIRNVPLFAYPPELCHRPPKFANVCQSFRVPK